MELTSRKMNLLTLIEAQSVNLINKIHTRDGDYYYGFDQRTALYWFLDFIKGV